MNTKTIFLLTISFICSSYLIEVSAQEISHFKQSSALNFENFNDPSKPKNYSAFSSNALFSNPHFIIPDFQINDDNGNTDQRNPTIAIDYSENLMIAWTDYRDGYFSIYAQYVLNDGSAIGKNVKVTDSTGIVYYQCAPSMAADSAGNYIIAWMDGREGFPNIYFQRLSKGGIKLGDNFKVNNEEQEHIKEHPTVAMGKEGNFVIAWSSSFYGSRNADIYAQRFSSDGDPIGLTFKVSDYLKYADHEHPALTIVDERNFIITWCEAGDSDREIYAQLFSCSGMPIGKNFKVNDDRTYSGQQYPDVAADDSGNFVIVWSDGRYSGKDIFAQRYNRNGIPIDKNFKVNDDDESASVQWYPAVSMDEKGNFIITWYDNRNGDYDIFAQQFLNDGSAFGTNFQVATNNNELQELPDIALRNNKVYNVWQDNHSDVSGYDVWANAMLFNSPPQWISSNMVTAYEDSSFEYHASAIDPEGFAIEYAFLHYPDWCSVADSIIYGTPPRRSRRYFICSDCI